jgi:hypothetical protein
MRGKIRIKKNFDGAASKRATGFVGWEVVKVRLLLHTHVLLWWLSDDRKLAKNARHLIANLDNDVLVSSASAWEISIEAASGRVEIDWMIWKMRW